MSKKNGWRESKIWLIGVILVAILLTGCQPGSEPLPEDSPEPERPSTAPTLPPDQNPTTASSSAYPAPAYPAPAYPEPVDTGLIERMTPEATPKVERVPSLEPAPVLGEVPNDIMQALQADLLAKVTADSTQVQVTRAEFVQWPDGSLGCPQPGIEYTQAIVPGYWVVLEVEGQSFDYRVTEKGYFQLCTNKTPPFTVPPGTPNS